MVELDKLVAVGRKHKTDMETFACGIALGLVEAVTRRQAFFLRFDQRHRHRLGIDIDLDPQNVINLPARTPARLAADDLNRPGGLLPPD